MNNSSINNIIKKIKEINSFSDLFDIQDDLNKIIEQRTQVNAIKITSHILELAVDLEEQQGPLFIEEIIDYIIQTSVSKKLNKETITELLRMLQKRAINKDDEKTRLLSIRLLEKFDPKNSSSLLVSICIDESEPKRIREQSLQSIEKIKLNNSQILLMARNTDSSNESYVRSLIKIIKKHNELKSEIEIQNFLEKTYQSKTLDDAIKCQALEALGWFGEIDALERACLLSDRSEAMNKALVSMLHNILERPINITQIRPENFELLTSKLLDKLGYKNVSTTRSVRDDGIDVIAYKENSGVSESQYKVIVQCKRYSSKQIDINTVEQLIKTIKDHKAKEGLLITTSTFSNRAIEFAENHQYIEMIDKFSLQNLLNKAFGDGRFYIKKA